MRSTLGRAAAFVRLGRPVFLLGGVVFYGLGAAAASFAGARPIPRVLFLGQLAISSVQLMTHYANDYHDLESDRANRTPTRWSGGSRVLIAGDLPPWTAMTAALALALIAILAAVYLHFALGVPGPAVAIVVLTLPLAWAYSAPPFRLCARGLGEIAATAVVAGLMPLAGFALQTGVTTALPLLASLPILLLQFAMLLAVAFPDAEGDAATRKYTLVVRLGPRRAAHLYAASTLAAYGVLPILIALGLPGVVAVAAGATAPIAAVQAWRAMNGAWSDPSWWERMTFRAVALVVLVALSELVAFLALTRAW